MTTNHPGKKLAALLSVVSLVATVSLAASESTTLFDLNFNDDATGDKPTHNAFRESSPNKTIAVVDSASTPADPFGGEQNKSFFIQDNAKGAAGEFGYVTWIADEKVSKHRVIFSLDIYVDTDGGNITSFGQSIHVGESTGGFITGGSGAALDLTITDAGSGGRFQVYNGSTFLSQGIDQSPQDLGGFNKVMRLKATLDPATSTYTMTINGTRLTHSGGDETFHFRNKGVSINAGQVFSTWARAAGRSFYDNARLELTR